MIGVDTNLLVRFITQDHTEQSRLFETRMKMLRNRDVKCFINIIVLCEMVWVLQSSYKFNKSQIIKVIDLLVESEDFIVEDADMVEDALLIYAKSSVGLTDVFIGLRNKHAACTHTYTYDKSAAMLDVFKLLA